MTRSTEPAAAAPPSRAFLLLLTAVTVALGWILVPFYGTILWGGIIALLFAPLHRWLLPRLGHRATPAALLTLLTAVVCVLLPFTIVSAAFAREAMLAFARVQSGQWSPARHLHRLFDALPPAAVTLLDWFGFADFDSLQQRLAAAAVEGSQVVAARALGFGQDTFVFVADLCITTYIAFFAIRDGGAMARAVQRAIPLPTAHKAVLFAKFTTVIRAAVKGNLLVAAAQGALGGLAFWVLGVKSALLWAVLMAFCSLLPAIGAALVWLPVAAYFFLAGAVWQSVSLVAYGVFVIGLIDNLLRPILVGKDTRMPDAVVMITTLGGMAVFGLNGFILGPAIAAMFIAVWHIHTVARTAAQHPG